MGASAAFPPTPADALKWNNSELVKWASELIDTDGESVLQEEDCDVLKQSRIKGPDLPTLTPEDLKLWGLPGAPAKRFLAAIKQLLSTAEGSIEGTLHSAILLINTVVSILFYHL